jgi:predicted amino acid racemase
MFVSRLQKDNPKFIDAIVKLQQGGSLLPDSYAVDMEQFRANAAAIVASAKEKGIKLYFMLKQIGRNPVLAQELVKLGYDGAVVVDFKEAQVMMRHNIPIGNVGHLVQIPEAMVEQVVAYGPEVITVYTADKVRSISRAAQKLGKVQKILVRVFGDGDMIYPGQTAGIHLNDLAAFVAQIRDLPGIQVAGITSFPCFLYSEKEDDIAPTPNLQTVLKAKQILEEIGITPEIINTPSATCCRTLELMAKYGCNCGEPGHGLTGTSPYHVGHEQPEKSCIAYVSEISHNFDGMAYCYGGGFYRRSHVENALVGTDAHSLRPVKVIPPSVEAIDYHFGLNELCKVGETVIMAFRFQVFVTRSDMVLIEGVAEGSPVVSSVWDSLGNQK